MMPFVTSHGSVNESAPGIGEIFPPVGDENPRLTYSSDPTKNKDYVPKTKPVIEQFPPVGDKSPHLAYSSDPSKNKDYVPKSRPIIEQIPPVGDFTYHSQNPGQPYESKTPDAVELFPPTGVGRTYHSSNPNDKRRSTSPSPPEDEAQKEEARTEEAPLWMKDSEDTVHEHGLLNLDRDCWSPLCHGGSCSYCGTGLCCKMGSFRGGCDGISGGKKKHVCTFDTHWPTPMNLGEECWNSADCTSGRCGYCGSGLCCRKGRKEFGCNGTVGGDRRHECVSHEFPRHGSPSARGGAPSVAAPGRLLVMLVAASWCSLSRIL